jgi:nitroreductase
MEVRDAIRTTGAVREFTDRPVDPATVVALLDDARFAPSGGNRQGWRVAIIDDLSLRRALVELTRPVWNEYRAIAATGVTPFTVAPPPEWEAPVPPFAESPNALIDGIDRIPVMLVVAADLAQVAMLDKDLDRATIVGGASVYPFCWSVLLAARERGLGGVITTFLSRVEAEARPLLGLPETWAIAATIFLGYPVHQPTKLRRNPVESFAFTNRFDQRTS